MIEYTLIYTVYLKQEYEMEREMGIEGFGEQEKRT
jgi:hypothetical protein